MASNTTTDIFKPFAQLDAAQTTEFIDDTVKYLKGHKVPFLKKFYEAFGANARSIVPSRDLLVDLIQMSLRRTTSSSTLDVFKQSVASFIEQSAAGAEFDPKSLEVIAAAVFARREELAKVLTELVFRQSQDSYLLDYNFNIETTLASDSFSKVNEQFLILELFLAHSGDQEEGKQIRRVIVEMNIDEARAFVSKLKEIEKVRNSVAICIQC